MQADQFVRGKVNMHVDCLARVLVRAMFVVLMLSLGAGGYPVFAQAQSAKPWFGLKMPDARERQSDKDRSIFVNPDFPPLSQRLPESEDPYADIKGDEVYAYLETIVEITRQNRPDGERFWGRIAGSAGEVETAEYIANEFRNLGLSDVQLEPVQGKNQWWPTNWEVTLIGDPAYGSGTADVTLKSAFPALQLGTGAISVSGLEAELIYVGRGHPVDLVDRNVKGKIAVVHANMEADPFFQSARGYIDGIVEAGAVGVITVMNAPGNHQYALEDMGPPDVPCLILGGDDGRFLEDAIAAAGPANPLTMRLSLEAEIREPWQSKNVLGLVPGQTDEYVVIVAHLDGYFESANDNAAGLASMLALAEHFARSGTSRPMRNHLLVGTSGHHEFSDGVEAFIVAHPDILEKTVLIFNVEHPSAAGSYYRGKLLFKRGSVPGQLQTTTTESTRSLTVSNQNELIISFYHEAIDLYGLVINSNLQRSPPTGDAFGFFRAGHKVVQILDANIWYHSDGDLPDSMYPSGLERATRLYAYVLNRVDQASRAELE